MTRPQTALALALSLLAACAIRSRTDRSWVGQVTPATAAPGCAASRGVLLMRDDDVTFAPDEGTWLLYGKASPGQLSATASRIGADRKNFATSLQATWSETAIAGTYTTPFCTYKIALTRN